MFEPLTLYFQQDGGHVSYACEKVDIESGADCDWWQAKFRVRDFDMESARRALADWQRDMRATFGESVRFARVNHDGSESPC